MSLDTPVPSRTEWTGFYYDGRTADREKVRVAATAAGLRLLRETGPPIVWPYRELRQTQGFLAGEQVRIERGGEAPEVLVVDDPGLVAAIRYFAPLAGQRFHDSSRQARLIAWAAAALAAATAFYFLGVPALARWLAPRIPVAWERELGAAVIEKMAPAARQCTDSTALVLLNRVVHRLSAAGAAPDSVRVTIVQDDAVNAFAAPGGNLVFSSGLLHAAETAEQVAGVAAHELQHVYHRHPTRAMVREVPLQIVVATLAGGNSDGLVTAVRAAGTLNVLRYRRTDEEEADRDGVRLMKAARVDARGLPDFLERISETRGGQPRLATYLSTHPHTTDRVAMLRRLAAPDSAPTPVLSPPDWSALQGSCLRPK